MSVSARCRSVRPFSRVISSSYRRSAQGSPRRSPSVLSQASSGKSSGNRLALPQESPTFGTHAIFLNQSIQNFSSISLSPNIKTLNLDNNKIVDFIGFVPSPSLETLKLANNPVASLRGMPHLPKLVNIDLSNSPFSRHQFSRTALLILFAKTLRSINGDRISATERQLAAAYPPGCDALVRGGWLVSYPPPSSKDLPRLTAALAATISSKKGIVPRTSPVLGRRPKSHAKAVTDALELQEQQLAKLEADIQKIQRRKKQLK